MNFDFFWLNFFVCERKILNFEIDVTPSIYNFFSIFSSSTPTINLCLAHLFCVWWFCPIFAQKKIENAFFNSPSQILYNYFFLLFFFSASVFLSNLSTANLVFKIDPLITILENFCTPTVYVQTVLRICSIFIRIRILGFESVLKSKWQLFFILFFNVKNIMLQKIIWFCYLWAYYLGVQNKSVFFLLIYYLDPDISGRPKWTGSKWEFSFVILITKCGSGP